MAKKAIRGKAIRFVLKGLPIGQVVVKWGKWEWDVVSDNHEGFAMWNVDFVQFARLLNEISAVGLDDKQMKAISASMNVKPDEVKQLLTRATTKWEELNPLLKKKTPVNEENSLEELAENGDVKAVVTMELDEIFGHFDDTAVESICDELADRATKMPASKINHKLLFADGDTLYMHVQVFPESEDEDVEELE